MADKPPLLPLDYRGPPPKRIKVPEDPESKWWRHRRILFRIGLFVVMFPITFYFGPNLYMFGKLTRLSAADFVATVQQDCVPIVRAMKEYQRDTGRLPNDMRDLVPKYVPSIQSFRRMGAQGGFTYFAEDQQIIEYDFTPGTEGWTVSGPFANGPIPLPPVTIGPSTQPVMQPK